MIDLHIKTDGVNVVDKLTKKDSSLMEVSLVLFRLEQAKQQLLRLHFDNEVEFKEDA